MSNMIEEVCMFKNITTFDMFEWFSGKYYLIFSYAYVVDGA